MTVSVTRPRADEAALLADALSQTFIENSRQTAVANIARARREVAYKITDTEEDILRLAEKLDEVQKSDGEEKPAGGQSDGSENAKETQLKARLQLANTLYGTLRAKHEELRTIEQLASGSLLLVDPASIPRMPVSPKPLLNIVLASALAVVLAGAGMLAADRLDNSLKDEDDAQRSLELPILGEIPLMPGGGLAAAASPAGEAFRSLRTNIQFCGLKRPVKTILVTSPEVGDGKTMVTANLSAILAYAGHNVISVDADLRRPRLHELFKLGNLNGLSTLLAALSDRPEDLLGTAMIRNLRVLPSGPQPPNSSEMLQTKRMTELLAWLREKADFVIIDSSPAGLITDAAVLARQVDGVLLVVSAGKTGREASRRAVRSLLRIEAPLLGVIVNKTTSTSIYNYHYYYHAHEKDQRRPDKTAKPVAGV